LNNLILLLLAKFHGLAGSFRDELGQTLAEYGLIMSVIAIAVLVLAVVAFRGTIIGAFTTAGTCISTAAANTGCGT
jgi:Flp pilus assembly pilin Flp